MPTTSLAQFRPRFQGPPVVSGELTSPAVYQRQDRLYAAFKLPIEARVAILEDFKTAGLKKASWVYRPDFLIRVHTNEEEENKEPRPLIHAKFLAATDANPPELFVAGAEKSIEAKFQPHLVETNRGAINTDGIIFYIVNYELLTNGKPSGKYIGYADKAPEFAAKFKHDGELRQVILVDKDQAATFRFKQDLGTSGK